jgi:hypothetical protein
MRMRWWTSGSEVLDKRRRALLIFGGGHLQRRNQLSNYQMDHPLAHTVISLLEQGGAQTFVVKTMACAQPGVRERDDSGECAGAVRRSAFFGGEWTSRADSARAVGVGALPRSSRCAAVPGSDRREKGETAARQHLFGTRIRRAPTSAHDAGRLAAARTGSIEEALREVRGRKQPSQCPGEPAALQSAVSVAFQIA